MKLRVSIVAAILTTAISVLSVESVIAQDGKVKIQVAPKQAYVFVDGNAIRDGRQTIALSVGKHCIAVYDYGFTPHTEDVDITSGKTTNLAVTLQAAGGNGSRYQKCTL